MIAVNANHCQRDLSRAPDVVPGTRACCLRTSLGLPNVVGILPSIPLYFDLLRLHADF